MSVQPIDTSVSSITGGSAERLEQFGLPDRDRLAPDQARDQRSASPSGKGLLQSLQAVESKQPLQHLEAIKSDFMQQ